MPSLIQDFRYALRQLRKSPGFTLTALFSLALGIGATTAVFNAVYSVLMNPYPCKNPERLVHLVLKTKAGRDYWPGFTGPQFQQLQRARCVENASGEDEWNLTTTGGDLPEDVVAIYFNSGAFQHFGVPALLGRELIPSDAPQGHDPQPAVVLGYKFWQHYYGGHRNVVGRPLQLVHKTYTVIGVLPPRFLWRDGDVYLPLKISADPDRTVSVNVRLKPGVTYTAADSELQGLLGEFAKEKPGQFPEQFRVQLKGLNERFVERLGKTLSLLLTSVALLLLIGCANVSILLLARGKAREHELAVRAALGAGRLRILTQLLIESLALSMGGAFLGILLARQTITLIAGWLPAGSFPSEAAIEINIPVLFFSIGLALVTCLLFGLSPALSLSHPEIARVIQTNTRKATSGLKSRRTYSMLITGQIALTALLMTAAGAAIGGFLHLLRLDLGYDPHDVMSIGIPSHDNMSWEDRSAYFEQLRERIGSLPEVISTGISNTATPPNNGSETSFEIFGKRAAQTQQLRANFVSAEYSPVLHISLTQGQLRNHSDTMRGAKVAVINETMAHRYWPNGNAVGRQIRLPRMKAEPPYSPGFPDSDGWLQNVGVVADARDDGLRNPILPAVYVPFNLRMRMFTRILVRTKVPPLSILHSVRAQVQRVSPDQQVMGNVRDLEQWITTQPEWAQQRLLAGLFGAFAFLALGLAAVGLYSVSLTSLPREPMRSVFACRLERAGITS